MTTDPHNPDGNGNGDIPDEHSDGPDEINGRHPGESSGSVPLADEPGPGVPLVAPSAPLVTCPPFRPGAVSLGPFDAEPFALQPITWTLPNGDVRQGPDLTRCLGEWLTGALESAGVQLGAFDRLIVHILAQDGWGTVQAIAGWITRATHHGNDHRDDHGDQAGLDPSGPDPDTGGEPRASP